MSGPFSAARRYHPGVRDWEYAVYTGDRETLALAQHQEDAEMIALALNKAYPAPTKCYEVELVCGDGTRRWFSSAPVQAKEAEREARELAGLGYVTRVVDAVRR